MDKTVEILLGWKNQLDVEVELENSINQTILQYKDLVEWLNSDIISMRNLAMQVKYENQASMQILELR